VAFVQNSGGGRGGMYRLYRKPRLWGVRTVVEGGVNGFAVGLVAWGWMRWILGKPWEVKWQVSA